MENKSEFYNRSPPLIYISSTQHHCTGIRYINKIKYSSRTGHQSKEMLLIWQWEHDWHFVNNKMASMVGHVRQCGHIGGMAAEPVRSTGCLKNFTSGNPDSASVWVGLAWKPMLLVIEYSVQSITTENRSSSKNLFSLFFYCCRLPFWGRPRLGWNVKW